MNARVHNWLRRGTWFARRRLGLAGAAGALLLLAALAAALGVEQLQAERREVLHQHVLRLDANARLAAPVAASVDPRDAAWRAIPSERERGAAVAQLLALLEQPPVAVSGAQYHLEDADAGLRRLRVTVPVHGAYAGVRRLAASILNTLPHAALDGLEVEHQPDTDQVDGRLRLSLFFRKEGA